MLLKTKVAKEETTAEATDLRDHHVAETTAEVEIAEAHPLQVVIEEKNNN
jgi:hypothetical protein